MFVWNVFQVPENDPPTPVDSLKHHWVGLGPRL